jgi:hypothetical protein
MPLPSLWLHPSTSVQQEFRGTSQYISELEDKLREVRENVLRHTSKAVQKQAAVYNRNRTQNPIKEGDYVLVKKEKNQAAKFPRNKFEGPYEVIKRHNYWSFQLKNVENGKTIDRNYNQLKKFHGSYSVKATKSIETSIDSLTAKSNTSTISDITSLPVSTSPEFTINSSRRYPIRTKQPPARFFPSLSNSRRGGV